MKGLLNDKNVVMTECSPPPWRRLVCVQCISVRSMTDFIRLRKVAFSLSESNQNRPFAHMEFDVLHQQRRELSRCESLAHVIRS